VEVKLGKNPGGGAAARTTTDSNGDYTFTNVPLGSYFIYIDVPNFPMANIISVTVTSSTPITNNDYYIDSAFVRIDSSFTTSLHQNNLSKAQLNVYPNPTTDILYLTCMGLIENGETQFDIEVEDILGKVVFRSESERSNKFKLNVREWNRGVYFIHAKTPENTYSSKFIKE